MAGLLPFSEFNSPGSEKKAGEAEVALAHLIADVQRGVWEPLEAREPEVEPQEVPTFYDYAAMWLARQRIEGGRDGTGISETANEDFCWRLNKHLFPHFAALRLDQITVRTVLDYRLAKSEERALRPGTINKTLATLSRILDAAVDEELIAKNPAKGRNLNAGKPKRTRLDRTDHIVALIEAAGNLDLAEGRRTPPWRRALVATLVLAGPRINETLALRWGDVDLANGRLIVRGTKTDAADREVDILPVLRDELLALAAARRGQDQDALVFGSSRAGRRYEGGRKQSDSNIRTRVLRPAIEGANEKLAKEGLPALPDPLTPHSLRRTFASVLLMLDEPLPSVMAQMGHETAAMTLEVYAGVMRRSPTEKARLRAFVDGANWQWEGNTAAPVSAEREAQEAA